LNKAKHTLGDQDGAFAVLIRLDQAITPYSFNELQNSNRNAARKISISRPKTKVNTINHPRCPAAGQG
jgi:hypothetical protein